MNDVFEDKKYYFYKIKRINLVLGLIETCYVELNMKGGASI